jgi:bacterioferritin
MKGHEKIIETLNARLSEELSAINQYFVHCEICESWGYKELHTMIRKRSIDEMKHAEKLISRILFLEGKPIVSVLSKINIGFEITEIHQNDKNAEDDAIRGYNQSIRLALELGDNGSRELFESILKEEEGHVDIIEAQLQQIKHVGVQNYLVEKIG